MAKYLKKIISFEDLKSKYRELLKENHPDNGGEVEKMQEINAEYDALFKIWKDRHESETGEKVTETAEGTRRNFYTQFGWAGKNYDSKLTLKQIAVIVRAYVKEKYPTCKFSVRTSYASMCQELHVAIKEFPDAMYKTGDDLRAEGLKEHIKTTISFGEHKGEPYEYDKYTAEIDEMERKLRRNHYFDLTSWTDEDLIKAYEEACKVSNFYAIKTEYFNSVITDVDNFVKSYNYEDCDGMQDYFDVNFYYFGCSFEGCKQVVKTARVADKASKAPATVRQPEEAAQEPQEQPETTTAEEVTTEEEKAVKNENTALETATEETTDTQPETVKGSATSTTNGGAFADMFADLAKAYINGKQAPKQPRRESKQEQPKKEPTAEEKPQEEPQKEPEEPKPEPIGYHGESCEVLTASDIETLTAGGTVYKAEERYLMRHHTAIPYQGAAAWLVYVISGETIEPGHDAKYSGFIVNGLYYQGTAEIRAKLADDINAELLRMIPDEETAARLFEESKPQEYERDNVKTYKEYSRESDAKQLYYTNKKPSIRLYSVKGDKISAGDVIRYLINPEPIIKANAEAFAASHRLDIVRDWIEYNKTLSAYNAIIADKTHEAHQIKRIIDAVTDEKTIKINLSNGHTVKAEARAVSGLQHSGYISSYYIAAADRQHIDRNEYGRAKDITVADIVSITHGMRTLYNAS